VNVLLAAITSLLILIFAAAFAAPYVVDWNEYRAVFEQQASKLAGRPVRVSGDVGLTILPVPEVRFGEVAIADPSGDFDAPSASARAFRMRLSFAPLLRGKIEAREIELDRLALRLGLDDDGHVIWPRIGDAAAGLPFLPANVSLKSVSLTEASVAVGRPGEPEQWRVSSISGELSADSLRGPFKFAGRAAIGKAARDIQLSIGRMGVDGAMPVKFVSRGPQAVYRAEGSVNDESGGPAFAGEVIATAANVARDAQPPWEATAQAKATLDGAALSDLKLTITRQRRPQTLTGAAEYSWSRGLSLDADLSSRWLDFDLLAGDDLQGQTPAQVMLRLPALLGSLPVPTERARIALSVAQINLGGGMIRDLEAVARRGEAGWGVEKLEAGLPGGSDIGFEGRFARKRGAPALAGTVRASGSHLGRLLEWAAPGRVAPDAAGARAFSLSGEVESGPGRFAISDISARLGESRFSGAVAFTGGQQARVSVDIDARVLDLRPFIAGTSAEALQTWLAGGSESTGWAGISAAAWEIDVNAERLVLPELAASDFGARLHVGENGIDVETLSLKGRDGLRVEVSGRYPREGAPDRAALKLALAADSADAAVRLARLVPGAGNWVSAHLPRLRAAAPFTLTASLRPSTLDDGAWLEVSGMAAQTAVKADARLYQDGRYHVFATANSPRLTPLLRQIAPGLGGWLDAESVPGAAQLSADVTGGDDAPIAGTARIEAGDVRLAFDGTAEPGDGTLRLDGRLALDAPQAAQVFALAGMARDAPEASGPFSLETALTHQDGVYKARGMTIRVEEEEATGTARLDLSGDRPVADITLAASRFALPAAASLLVEAPLLADVGLDDGYWPDTPFALAALDRLSAQLAIKAEELVLGGMLSIRDAAITARLDKGALRLNDLTGRLYDGDVRANASLRAERGRAVFEGEISVEELDLAQLPHGDGAPLALGRASMELALESEGITPRGLMTVMSGSGLLSLTEGEIRGVDPQVLTTTARGYLEVPEQPEMPAAEMLGAPLRASRLAHDGAEIALDMKDGDLRAKPTRLYRSGAGEKLTAEARLDLTSMRLSSQWTLAAPLEADEPLPEVRMTFAAPLADFGAMTPRIGAADYEQFLTVKRIERNVERLEELERQRRRAPSQRPADAEDAPSAGLSAAPTTPEPETSADPQLREDAPLAGFQTEIEEAPRGSPSSGARDDVPDNAAPQPPAAASSTPGAPLDDPQVVEDARRELLRERPRPRRREPDGFFEIFRN